MAGNCCLPNEWHFQKTQYFFFVTLYLLSALCVYVCVCSREEVKVWLVSMVRLDPAGRLVNDITLIFVFKKYIKSVIHA